jgi:hypothetical protein
MVVAIILVALLFMAIGVSVMLYLRTKRLEEEAAKRDNAGVNLIMGILGAVL